MHFIEIQFVFILGTLTCHTVGTPAATLAVLLAKEIHIDEAVALRVHLQCILQLLEARYWHVLRHRAVFLLLLTYLLIGIVR